MKSGMLLLCILMAGCAAAPPVTVVHEAPVVEERVEPRCPPLPLLPANPTREQRELHHLTVITLYGQCAGSVQ